MDGSDSTSRPSVPDSTMTKVFTPSSSTAMTKSSHSAAFGTMVFTPLRTTSSPSSFAVVCSSKASNIGRASETTTAAGGTDSPEKDGR